MRRIFTVVLVALFVPLASVGQASALSCAAEGPQQIYDRSDAVFVGTVVSVTEEEVDPNEPQIGGAGPPAMVVFDVTQVLKGSVPDPVEVAYDLGFSGEAGDRFVVAMEDDLASSICSTFDAADPAWVAFIDSLNEPEPVPPVVINSGSSGERPLLPVAVVVAAVWGAALLARRQRA